MFKRLRAGTLLALTGVWLLGATSVQSATASTNQRVQVDARPGLPLFAAVDHRLAASKRMHLTIELKPTDAAGLAAEAAAVSNPGSPDFHRYLSVNQFASRFGSNAAAIDAVSADLRASGMQVSSAGSNGLFLTVDGNAGQADLAFHTDISKVTLDNGRVAFANLRAPSLPAAIASDVTGVIGLDDIHPVEQNGGVEALTTKAQKAAQRRTIAADFSGPMGRRPARSSRVVGGGGPQPCATATNISETEGGYTIDEQASAYQLSSLYGASDFGAGQTVGILELQAYNPTDVSTYFACYGIDPTVNQINVDGGPGAYNSHATDDGESAMDIEVVGGIAPQAAIDVYEAGLTDTSWVPVLNAAVSADQAKVISSSVAICEPDTPAAVRSSDQTLLEEAAAQGQSFYVASGDSGAESCSQLGEGSEGWNSDVNIDEPGAQPYATAVGGTSLFSANGAFDWNGAVPEESVWNDGTNTECGCGGENAGAGGGSGGGLSADFAMPSYQQDAASTLGVINSASAGQAVCGQADCREVPDISADGDLLFGYVTYIQGEVNHGSSWTVEGGTSAGAPLWAGLTALVNADPACGGRTVGFVNPSLYEIASSAYAANFNDPTYASPISHVNNNDTLDQFGASTADPSFLYPSLTGYDMATGIGTPIGGTLAQSLCSMARNPTYTVSVTGPGDQTTTTGSAVSLQIAGADSGNAALSYSATGLPAGLSISSTGLISGTPTTSGSSTVTVTASDQYTNSGSATFAWNVTDPAPQPSTTPPATSTPTTPSPAPPATTTTTTTPQISSVTPKAKPAASPKITAAALGGSTTGKPKLTFVASAGTGNVKSVQVKLPSGLAFSNKAKTLAKYIAVTSGSKKLKFTVSGGGSTLTIKLKGAAAKINVAVAYSALTESSSMKTEIKKKKVKTLKVAFAVVASSGKPTALSATVKV